MAQDIIPGKMIIYMKIGTHSLYHVWSTNKSWKVWWRHYFDDVSNKI